jgi:hypothetical protein
MILYGSIFMLLYIYGWIKVSIWFNKPQGIPFSHSILSTVMYFTVMFFIWHILHLYYVYVIEKEEI